MSRPDDGRRLEQLRSSSGFGFVPQGSRDQATPVKLEKEPVPITKKDFGLVLLAKDLDANHLDTEKFDEAELVIDENGTPQVSQVQAAAEHQSLLYARAQGRPFERRLFPYFIERKGEEQNRVDVYGFPGNILRWSMGTGYSSLFPSPVFPFVKAPAQKSLHPSFDETTRIYTPDFDELKELGYSEEGQRRLANFALVTRFASYANGSDKVKVNPDDCTVFVSLDTENTSFKTAESEGVVGFMFSLLGVHALLQGFPMSRVADLTEMKNTSTPQGYTKQVEEIVSVCKDTITRELNRRETIIQSAQAATVIFDHPPEN